LDHASRAARIPLSRPAKLLSVGPYPEVAGKGAQNRRQCPQPANRGSESSEIKKQKKAALSFTADNTFAKFAARLVAKKKDGRADVTIAKMEWILGKLANSLGQRPMDAIRTPEVIQVLKREEDADNLETARRMRTVIGEIFRYAMQHGIALHRLRPFSPCR
jgi:hypothetical protein